MNQAKPFQLDWKDKKLTYGMMFLYKTRKCPHWKNQKCHNSDDQCFDAHSQVTRRRPPILINYNQWNYSYTDKCLTGYPSHSGKSGKKCRGYHSQHELNYHPMEYKTRPCNDFNYKRNGICSRGPICWQYHENLGDQRDIKAVFTSITLEEAGLTKYSPPPEQYQNYLIHIKSQSIAQPPLDVTDQKDFEKHKCQSKDNGIRSEHIAHAHLMWLDDINTFYGVFKNKICPKGSQCITGINCMDYHTSNDKRRDQSERKYSQHACPNVWDYEKKTFIEDTICNNGDNCEYSHNFYESWYHQNSYKILPCPYLKLTKMTDFYKKKECPFNRRREWFDKIDVLNNNRIKEVQGNIITLLDGQHLCLDYCPFYHSSTDQRFMNEPMPVVFKCIFDTNISPMLDHSAGRMMDFPPSIHIPEQNFDTWISRYEKMFQMKRYKV